MNSPSDNIKDRIREKFSLFLCEQKSSQISGLLEQIESNHWEAYFFGGVPRAAVAKTKGNPRDYDIVFSDEDFKDFSEYAESVGGRKNRFGGYKIDINGIKVDAWSLSDTWAFREQEVDDVSFENLQLTVPFNVDSFLIEIFPKDHFHARNVFCEGYLNAIENRLLQIVLKSNPFPSLCLVRALRLSHSFCLEWPLETCLWMDDIINNVNDDHLRKIQLSHYEEVVYDSYYWHCLKTKLKDYFDSDSVVFSPPRHESAQLCPTGQMSSTGPNSRSISHYLRD